MRFSQSRALAALALLVLAYGARSASPDPADPAAQVPAPPYVSVFSSAPPPLERSPDQRWRQANRAAAPSDDADSEETDTSPTDSAQDPHHHHGE